MAFKMPKPAKLPKVPKPKKAKPLKVKPAKASKSVIPAFIPGMFPIHP